MVWERLGTIGKLLFATALILVATYILLPLILTGLIFVRVITEDYAIAFAQAFGYLFGLWIMPTLPLVIFLVIWRRWRTSLVEKWIKEYPNDFSNE